MQTSSMTSVDSAGAPKEEHSRIRVGVIGFGLAGRVFHAPFIAAVPELELAAIVQRSGDDAARAYPDAVVYRSAEALLASDVDVVVVATPNDTHVPLATAALRAGKHVVVDKPLAPTAAEAEALEALAQETGRLLVPFHNRRFDGDFLTLQTLVNRQAVGRAVVLRSRIDRYRPAPRANSWKESAAPAHGLLMDLGPHLVDQPLVLFGRPDSITASVRTDRDTSAIEDAFDLTLHFEHNGRPLRVELGATMLAAAPEPRFRLLGTAGAWLKTGMDPQEPTLVAGATVPPVGSAHPWLPEPETQWGILTTPGTDATSTTAQPVPTEPGDYRFFYQAVAAALQGTGAPPATPRDAVRVAQLLELARESSRTGRTLAVNAEGW